VLALGIAAAIGASLLYNTSIALQALEAREVPGEHSLRPSLIGRLVRNKRWLGATALGFAGWPLEIGALLLAPLTVVQPCLASGLILLLWLGAKKLGEAPGRSAELSISVAGLRQKIEQLLRQGGRDAALAWVMDEVGLSEAAALQPSWHIATLTSPVLTSPYLGTIPFRSSLSTPRWRK